MCKGFSVSQLHTIRSVPFSSFPSPLLIWLEKQSTVSETRVLFGFLLSFLSPFFPSIDSLSLSLSSWAELKKKKRERHARPVSIYNRWLFPWMSWRILSVVDQSREWLPADGFYNRLLFEELSEKRKKKRKESIFFYFRGCDRRKPKCVFILCIFFIGSSLLHVEKSKLW